MNCHSNSREPEFVADLLKKKINDLEGIQSHSYDNITRRNLLSDLGLGGRAGTTLSTLEMIAGVVQPGLAVRCVPEREVG